MGNHRRHDLLGFSTASSTAKLPTSHTSQISNPNPSPPDPEPNPYGFISFTQKVVDPYHTTLQTFWTRFSYDPHRLLPWTQLNGHGCFAHYINFRLPSFLPSILPFLDRAYLDVNLQTAITPSRYFVVRVKYPY
jgi:hypothetical protein